MDSTPRCHDLERGGLQDDLGIGLVKRLGKGFRGFEKGSSSFSRPQTISARPTNLAVRREDQPYVVAGIHAPQVAWLSQIVVEEFGERDRPIEIVLQHRPRDRRIELKSLGVSRHAPEYRDREKTHPPEQVQELLAHVDHVRDRWLRE